jgi:hypothetical protein
VAVGLDPGFSDRGRDAARPLGEFVGPLLGLPKTVESADHEPVGQVLENPYTPKLSNLFPGWDSAVKEPACGRHPP